MKIKSIPLLIIIMMLVMACHTSKKSTTLTTNANANKSDTTRTVSIQELVEMQKNYVAQPAPKPTNEELTAIQLHFKEVTMEQLSEGYKIYAHGACLNCHEAPRISKIDPVTCRSLIMDMAKRAQLNAEQSDAVYKYVLSVMATQKK